MSDLVLHSIFGAAMLKENTPSYLSAAKNTVNLILLGHFMNLGIKCFSRGIQEQTKKKTAADSEGSPSAACVGFISGVQIAGKIWELKFTHGG